MSAELRPGMTLPTFELPDENCEIHRLSDLQGESPMILLPGCGKHCPGEVRAASEASAAVAQPMWTRRACSSSHEP